eukprot:scaffold360_cov128-Isochrysis_galbana.AAC.3
MAVRRPFAPATASGHHAHALGDVDISPFNSKQQHRNRMTSTSPYILTRHPNGSQNQAASRHHRPQAGGPDRDNRGCSGQHFAVVVWVGAATPEGVFAALATRA